MGARKVQGKLLMAPVSGALALESDQARLDVAWEGSNGCEENPELWVFLTPKSFLLSLPELRASGFEALM